MNEQTVTSGPPTNETAQESGDNTRARKQPALSLRFLSHGTLECKNIDRTRQFYEEFFGFEVVRPSKISLWIRLGGQHIYVVVQSSKPEELGMGFLNHNGIDVWTEEEVDQAYKVVCEQAQTWGLHKISKPTVQHGTYSFYFWDMDENCWEILSNPEGGYTWMFERGDQEGMGHLKKSFARPDSTLRKKTP